MMKIVEKIKKGTKTELQKNGKITNRMNKYHG